jgi:hypothetical protein
MIRTASTVIVAVPEAGNKRTIEAMMPKVLYALEAYPELSETYIEVERRLVAQRCETHAISFLTPGTFNPDHLSYVHLRKKRTKWPLARRHALRGFRPDIVHTHWLTVTKYAQGFARMFDVPWTVRSHSFDVMDRPAEAIASDIARCNESDCAGVIVFPFLRTRLLEAGLREDKLVDCLPVVDVAMFQDVYATGDGVIHMGATKKKKNFPGFIKLATLCPEREFTLIPLSRGWDWVEKLNEDAGNPVTMMRPIRHAEMPDLWRQQKWLVYAGDRAHPSTGWPIAVCEAWAAGVGVCLQKVRPDMEDYVGDCGHVFDEVEDSAELIKGEPDPAMLERGRQKARTIDAPRHIDTLFDLWRGAGIDVRTEAA